MPRREDPAAVADELMTTIGSIRRTGRRHAPRPVELSELSGAQIELAKLVRRRPRISVMEAAQELRVAPNTVSTLVRKLTEAGVLVRAVDEDDRRVARLELAPAVAQRIGDWRDERVAALGEAIAALPEADQRRLRDAVDSLGRLAERFEAQVNERLRR